MAEQIITGSVKDLGASNASGTIMITPAVYPQSVDGVLISSTPIVATISAGLFTISATCGSKVRCVGKDSLGRTFIDLTFTVTYDDSLNIANYVNPPTVGEVVSLTVGDTSPLQCAYRVNNTPVDITDFSFRLNIGYPTPLRIDAVITDSATGRYEFPFTTTDLVAGTYPATITITDTGNFTTTSDVTTFVIAPRI